MTTKTIFNMDTKLKKAAVRKARKQGVTLTMALNMATRAYVQDRIRRTTIERDIEEGLEDIKSGRVISQEELFKKLRLQRR
jgi:predicted transcriptional regulator